MHHESAQPGIIVTMAGGSTEIWQALEAADALPPGRARIERLEELVALADAAEDPEQGTAARLSLVPAYLYGGRHREIGPVLTWLLQRYDEEPAWFGPWERQGVLFSFTWATSSLLPHPDVPLAQIEAALADMSARYTFAGESPTPVLKVRFDLAAHRHGHAEAVEAFEAWNLAPRSDLSNCPSCEAVDTVRHLAATGRHEEAAELALVALDGPDECRAQPFGMIAASMESLLLTGHEERAALEHLRGVRLLRLLEDDDADPGLARHPDQAHGPVAGLPGRAEHLLLLGRSGNLERGLSLLQSWMPWLGSGGAPAHQLMVTAAAAARLLRSVAEAGGGELLIPTGRWGDVSVQRLGTRLAGRARELAARFDARNGTDGSARLVADLLESPPLPPLPLELVARSPRYARVPAPEPTSRPQGRRAAGTDLPQALADAGDLVGLAEAFGEASAADSHTRRAAVLAAWRGARPIYDELEDDDVEGCRAAARLDGWLAVSDLEDSGAEVDTARTAAAEAADRLRRAGLPVEALLHEQACVLAAAHAGRMDGAEAMTRIGKTAAQVSAEGTPAQIGLAYCRLALAREAGALSGDGETADTSPTEDPAGTSGSRDPLHDPVEQALAALTAVDLDTLDHQARRALCRMLRLRAMDEPAGRAVDTLHAAVGALPEGVRPLERAMAHAQLAALLVPVDPAAGLAAYDAAVADAMTADAADVLGGLLAEVAAVRLELGLPVAAEADLARAVPLLDEHAEPGVAAQARTDLSRALLGSGRPVEAAEVAEAAVADLTAQIAELEDRSPLEYDDRDPEMVQLIHLAGTAAYVAAETAIALGDPTGARVLAARSAAWHRRNANLLAQSEAWQLAARCGGTPVQVIADLQRATELADEGGHWDVAATCRRERVLAVQEAHGPDAALAALAEADEVLQTLREASIGDSGTGATGTLELGHRLAWHRAALAEQRGRLLALIGRYADALTQVEGLEESYRTMDDARSAREVRGLRGQLLAELGDLDGARHDLQRAAEEAELAGDAGQARGLGQRLAAVLDEAGLPGDAEDAWARFCAPPEPVLEYPDDEVFEEVLADEAFEELSADENRNENQDEGAPEAMAEVATVEATEDVRAEATAEPVDEVVADGAPTEEPAAVVLEDLAVQEVPSEEPGALMDPTNDLLAPLPEELAAHGERRSTRHAAASSSNG